MSLSRSMPTATFSRWLPRTALSSGVALICVGTVAGWLAVALVGPFLSPFDPLGQAGVPLSAPSHLHVFGTDELGRDIASRVIWGARVSIPYSLLIVAISGGLGMLLGGIAGYFGGWVDEVIMRFTDFVFAFPSIILAMAIAGALGADLRNAVIAIVIVSWPTYARVVRSLVLPTMHSEFVLAARLLGKSPARALFVDVLPNVIGPILVYLTLGLGNAMLFLAGLSFLGLGLRPPTAEWGSMISDAAQYYDRWWLALFPGLAIVSVVLAVNILGDRLRGRWEPSQISS